jgi:ribosome biogenesis protein Tsr3
MYVREKCSKIKLKIKNYVRYFRYSRQLPQQLVLVAYSRVVVAEREQRIQKNATTSLQY